MNGIEKITQRIAQDNQQEIEALLEKAHSEAREIIAGYKEKAQADYDEAVAQGKADADYRVERMQGVSQLEARKLKLSAKQEMLDKAFDAALSKLLSLPDDRYTQLLTNLAVSGSTTGKEALIFSVKDRARCGKAVVIAANAKLEAMGRTAQLTLSEESREFDGGLYIQDGNIENNCTFSTIVRILREQMAAQVAAILFD